jgi:hypothetical protein
MRDGGTQGTSRRMMEIVAGAYDLMLIAKVTIVLFM